jgi:hypothetical protein
MIMRMVRKMIVVMLAAFGVQYLRMVARVIVQELRPQSSYELEQAAARAHAARQTAMNRKRLAPRRVRISTLEPHGAI